MENIRFLSEDRKVYDKKAIAIALAGTCDEDELVCGFLENGIINSCEKCEVRDICHGLDKLVKEHKEKTTTVISKFSF